MTEPAPLSPAVQAVLEASGQWCYLRSHRLAIAAALRAAADQVVPETDEPDWLPQPINSHFYNHVRHSDH